MCAHPTERIESDPHTNPPPKSEKLSPKKLHVFVQPVAVSCVQKYTRGVFSLPAILFNRHASEQAATLAASLRLLTSIVSSSSAMPITCLLADAQALAEAFPDTFVDSGIGSAVAAFVAQAPDVQRLKAAMGPGGKACNPA
jgi:hypothetical protein